MRFPLVPILILAALTPTLSSSVEFPDAPTEMPADPADLAGTYLAPDHPGFAGWEYHGGSMVFEHIGLAHYANAAGRTIAVISWMLPSGEGPATWLITDAIDIGGLAPGDRLYTHCQPIETNITVSMFAIGPDNWEDAEITDLDRAWTIQARDGSLSPANVWEIVCINDGM